MGRRRNENIIDVEDKIKKLAELIDEITGNGLEYMFLCSMISSDNIRTIEDAEKSLESIENVEKALPLTVIPNDKKKEFEEYIKKGREILNADIERFKNEK